MQVKSLIWNIDNGVMINSGFFMKGLDKLQIKGMF